MLFRQIVDLKLAQYAYLIGCQRTGEAVVIDPERDVDRYLRIAESEGLIITAVAETHIHADFLSGAREFAERGVRVFLSDEGDEDWKYQWIAGDGYDICLLKEGDTFHVGNIELRAVHTPGHTPEHLSFFVTDHGGGVNEPMGFATGDFVFVGDLGRPDLLESAAKIAGRKDPSARSLFASVQRFLDLPDYLQIWPGHGAGSACGKELGAIPQSTVGYERRFNAAIDAARKGEDAFVEAILGGQPEPPLYFARMKRLNKDGAPLLKDLPRPERVRPDAIAATLALHDPVPVDTRLDTVAFMARHLPRSLYAPLNKNFNTAVGSTADPAKNLFLVLEEDRVDEAVRDLVRVGYDNMRYYVTPADLEMYFDGGGEGASIERVDFEHFQAGLLSGDVRVLDVRFASEYASAHVPGAINISYTRLADRMPEIEREGRYYVHCGGGRRAAVASALLARAGRDVAFVDGSFVDWAAKNLTATNVTDCAGVTA